MAHTLYSRALQLLVVLLSISHGVLATLEFRAAPKGMHLRRRDASLAPRHEEHSLVYGYYASEDDILPYSAVKVSFQPKLPTVILEDTVAHDAAVHCTGSHIKLRFPYADAMASVRDTWTTHEEFILVTSAEACAPEGEHAAYIVKALTFVDPYSVTLEAIETSLKNCTDRLYFDMGNHVVPHVHPKVKRTLAPPRQEATTTLSDEVSLIVPPPTETPTAASSSGDIGFSKTDLKLFPPDSSIVNLVPQLRQLRGLTITCKNCTMTGTLELLVAGFELDTNIIDAGTDFLDEGFFQFNAKNMAATMAFEFDFAPGFLLTNPSFIPQLPAINLIPIGVKGLLTFGPQLQLTFPFNVILNSPVKYTAGFTFQVPDDSKVVLNVSDIESSFATGFADSTLDPLPWEVDADDLSLNFTAGFRPQLLMVAGLGDKVDDLPVSANGSAGFFLDIPSYTAVVTAVKNKTDNCVDDAPPNESNTRIHIEPFQFFRAGYKWDLGLKVGSKEISRVNITPFAEKSIALPEQCLLFNSETRIVVQADGKGSGNGDKNAAGTPQASMGGLALVIAAACFMLL